MTMDATITLINTKVTEAIDANENQDYQLALSKIRSAKLLLASLPSRSAKDGAELEFSAESIDTLFAEFRRAAAGAAGIQTTKITYERDCLNED
jgi:hypothetical protein